MLGEQFEIIKRIRDRLKSILFNLRNAATEEIDSDSYFELTFIDYQLVYDLISMERKFFIADQGFIGAILKEIKELNLPVLSIDKDILDHAE